MTNDTLKSIFVICALGVVLCGTYTLTAFFVYGRFEVSDLVCTLGLVAICALVHMRLIKRA